MISQRRIFSDDPFSGCPTEATISFLVRN